MKTSRESTNSLIVDRYIHQRFEVAHCFLSFQRMVTDIAGTQAASSLEWIIIKRIEELSNKSLSRNH